MKKIKEKHTTLKGYTKTMAIDELTELGKNRMVKIKEMVEANKYIKQEGRLNAKKTYTYLENELSKINDNLRNTVNMALVGAYVSKEDKGIFIDISIEAYESDREYYATEKYRYATEEELAKYVKEEDKYGMYLKDLQHLAKKKYVISPKITPYISEEDKGWGKGYNLNAKLKFTKKEEVLDLIKAIKNI